MRLFPSAPLILVAALATPTAQAALISIDSVSRDYSGNAVASSATETRTVPLAASASAPGSLGEQWVNNQFGGVNTVARGLAADVQVSAPDAAHLDLGLATATRATHQAQSVVIYSPGYANVTAAVALVATIDLSGRGDQLLGLTTARTVLGTNNTGSLSIVSALHGELLNLGVAALSPTWETRLDGGDLVTLSVSLASYSFQDAGNFVNTIYADNDSQGLTLGLALTPVPLPPTALLLALGLFGAGLVRRTGGRVPAPRPGRQH